jgi:hypothetical protein
MTDDEIRSLMESAHSGDTPPPIRTLLARPAPRRRPWWPAVAIVVAASVTALLVWPRAPRPRAVVAYHAPLDFLLDVPGTNLLRDVPRFDLKGSLP